MNTTTVVGTLGRDPELRFSQTGTAWATSSVAVNRKVNDNEVTTWFNLKLFGTMAENAANCLRKGNRVVVTGRIEVSEFQGRDGEKRTAVDLVVDEIGPSLRFSTAQVVEAVKTYSNQRPEPSRGGVANFDDQPF